jgi:hypothetical protein
MTNTHESTQRTSTQSEHKAARQKAGWEYYQDHRYLLTDSVRATTSTAHTAYTVIQGFDQDASTEQKVQKMMTTLHRFRQIALSVAKKVYGSEYLPNTGLYSSPRFNPVDYYFPKWLKTPEGFTVEAFNDQYVVLKSSQWQESPNFMYHRELLYRDLFSLSDRAFAKLFRHYCKAEKARFRLIDLYHMEEELKIMEQRKAYLLAGQSKRKELLQLSRYTGKH